MASAATYMPGNSEMYTFNLNYSPDLQTYVFNRLLGISTWLSQWHLKLKLSNLNL